jgi:hypothetical protein
MREWGVGIYSGPQGTIYEPRISCLSSTTGVSAVFYPLRKVIFVSFRFVLCYMKAKWNRINSEYENAT